MKFITVCLSLLLILLALCSFSSIQVRKAVEETTALLEQAVTARGPDCVTAIRTAAKAWKEHEAFFGTVLRHDEIDDVLSEFARLEAYAITNDTDEFLANCAALLATLEHIREMEKPSLQNIM